MMRWTGHLECRVGSQRGLLRSVCFHLISSDPDATLRRPKQIRRQLPRPTDRRGTVPTSTAAVLGGNSRETCSTCPTTPSSPPATWRLLPSLLSTTSRPNVSKPSIIIFKGVRGVQGGTLTHTERPQEPSGARMGKSCLTTDELVPPPPLTPLYTHYQNYLHVIGELGKLPVESTGPAPVASKTSEVGENDVCSIGSEPRLWRTWH